MSFTKITTAGAGTMGSQVAWQMAFHGKHVVVYDAIPDGLREGRRRCIGSTRSTSSSGAAPPGSRSTTPSPGSATRPTWRRLCATPI